MPGEAPKRGAAEWLFATCGVWLVGLGLYFVFVRPALLPEDVRYMGAANAEALQVAVPGLTAWLGKVFKVMGGFMAGAGVLVFYLARHTLPHKPRGTLVSMTLAGVATVGLMSGVNFALHSDFRWLLVMPALAWLVGLLLLLAESKRSA